MTPRLQQAHLTANVRKSTWSGGSPLGPVTRAVMEDRFGQSFGHVRVHTGPSAAIAARVLGARAFTVGSHIFFGEGRYDPQTWPGRRLLAHELVHVIQQASGAAPAYVDDSRRASLEYIADEAAEIVAAGASLPSGFGFGSAPTGLVQCHTGGECPGTRYSAREPSVWMAANQAIELAYKNDPRNANHVMFFGSDFENSLLKIGPEVPFPVPNRRPSRPGVAEVTLPRGTKNRFRNLLLLEFRGLQRQRRPDIIDFTTRTFYEIKSTTYADLGTVQLRSYYKITEKILMAHGQDERPWVLETSPLWYPDHVLAMLSPNPQTLSLVVCTEATDHRSHPGMILYEVRRVRRRRRRQRTREIRVYDFWTAYDVIRPMVRASLPKALPFFDPDSPDYVIIIPDEFFKLDFVKQLAKEARSGRGWEPFRVQSEFSRNRIRPSSIPGLTPENFLMFALVMAAGGVIALVVLISGAAIVEVAAGATALTATEAGATAATGTAAGVESTIVVPAGIAAQVAGGTSAAATTVETATLASYEALLASPAAQKLAASAGVALVLGTSTSAQADPSKPTIDQIIPVRVIPNDDFKQIGSMPHAFSDDIERDLPNADMTKFFTGNQVFFDNKMHWIFGHFSVR